jgi:hypothetical protein
MSPPEGALNQADQLIGSSIDGLLQGRRMLSDRDGLAAFQARFHHAALVVRTALIAVLIGQMYLHTRDVIAHSVEGRLNYIPDLIGQRLVTFDGMVCIDLDLHIHSFYLFTALNAS